jgi:lipopolysaccharide export system protein LptA
MVMQSKSLRTLSVFCVLFVTVSLDARQETNLPITIQADSATVNELEGTSVYRGNVIIEQGSLKITADEILIESQALRPSTIVAKSIDKSTGHARFEQATRGSKGNILAQGKLIRYNVSLEKLEIKGQASLTQGGDRYEGDNLSYDLPKGLLVVHSKDGEDGRINLTINPKPGKP